MPMAGMRRNCSQARGLDISIFEKDLQDAVCVRDTPESKALEVHFEAGLHCLKINVKQVLNRNLNSFTVARISYKDLVVGWLWEQRDMFIIAQEIKGVMYDEIFCFPINVHRNIWLRFFEHKRVKSMPVFFHKDKHVIFKTNLRYIMNPVQENDITEDKKSVSKRRHSME